MKNFTMLELNPNDNQGARFLLHDLDEGLGWEESVAREEETVGKEYVRDEKGTTQVEKTLRPSYR